MEQHGTLQLKLYRVGGEMNGVIVHVFCVHVDGTFRGFGQATCCTFRGTAPSVFN